MTRYWNIDGLPDGDIHMQSTIDGFINAVTMGEGTHYPHGKDWGKDWGNAWTACFIELDYNKLRPRLTKKAVTCPQCIAHEKSTEGNPSCQQKSTSENEHPKAARSGG